jgi:hypothetical protein
MHGKGGKCERTVEDRRLAAPTKMKINAARLLLLSLLSPPPVLEPSSFGVRLFLFVALLFYSCLLALAFFVLLPRPL